MLRPEEDVATPIDGHDLPLRRQPVAVLRQAARLLILDPEDRVLLIRCLEPDRRDARPFWITPGGGVHEGETLEQAAAREAAEEMGAAGLDIGPAVWRRRHVFLWRGVPYDQRETFFLCRVRSLVVDRRGETADEILVHTQFRWWDLEQLRAAVEEQFAPRGIARHLATLLREGPPPQPVDVGV